MLAYPASPVVATKGRSTVSMRRSPRSPISMASISCSRAGRNLPSPSFSRQSLMRWRGNPKTASSTRANVPLPLPRPDPALVPVAPVDDQPPEQVGVVRIQAETRTLVLGLRYDILIPCGKRRKPRWWISAWPRATVHATWASCADIAQHFLAALDANFWALPAIDPALRRISRAGKRRPGVPDRRSTPGPCRQDPPDAPAPTAPPPMQARIGVAIDRLHHV